MSRIAGILGELSGTAGQDVKSMMERMMGSSNWMSVIHSTGQAVMGWCGSSGEGSLARNAPTVVLDGTVYDPRVGCRGETPAVAIGRMFLQWGFEGVLQKLNGDFAIAIYDPGEGCLWLARDRFGVKPLYYSVFGSRIAFASRPGALRLLPWIDGQPDPGYVRRYAGGHYRYIDQDPMRSPYLGIDQIPPGHFVRFKAGSWSLTRYWQIEPQEEWPKDEDTLAEEFRGLFADSVSIRLRGTRKSAFTLSGGLDSSSVLVAAKALTGEPQMAVSAVYSDPTFDETREIAPLGRVACSRWIEVRVDDPPVLEMVEEMVRWNDEPVATATWLSHYLLCQRLVSEGADTLFGGLGGDELHAGEYEYFVYFFADLLRQGDLQRFARESDAWMKLHQHPVYRKTPAALTDALKRLVDFSIPGKCLPDVHRMLKYDWALHPELRLGTDFVPNMEGPFDSYLKNRCYQDLTRETLPCCLRALDRHTAPFSLDVRLPFLDHRLAEFMFRVPGAMKIRDGVMKCLLRRSMEGFLPEETRLRGKKTGWNAPAHVWFAGVCREPLLDLVRSRRFRERGVYQPLLVEALIRDHVRIVSGACVEENHMMFLWQLINLEIWLGSLGEERNLASTSRRTSAEAAA